MRVPAVSNVIVQAPTRKLDKVPVQASPVDAVTVTLPLGSGRPIPTTANATVRGWPGVDGLGRPGVISVSVGLCVAAVVCVAVAEV